MNALASPSPSKTRFPVEICLDSGTILPIDTIPNHIAFQLKGQLVFLLPIKAEPALTILDNKAHPLDGALARMLKHNNIPLPKPNL